MKIIVMVKEQKMICNLCKSAADYYTAYKKNNKRLSLLNARQLHWACANSPRNNGSCFCGHRTEDEVE
jgi:hypothetical protein